MPQVGGGPLNSKSMVALVAVILCCLVLVTWFRPWPEGGAARSTGETTEPADEGSVALTSPEVIAAAGAEGPERIEIAGAAGSKVTIDVTVRENGGPLPDFEVELWAYTGAGELGTPERRALRTDTHGRATVSMAASDGLRTFKLAMDDPRRRMWCDPVVVVPSERHVIIETTTVHFGGVLRGVVRDAHDTPIGGATVASNWNEARSDAEGRYQLQVPIGPWQRPVYAHAPGFRLTDKTIELPAGATEHGCDLVLLPSGQITGRVLDNRGAPVAGARIQASGSFLQYISGADGRFVVDHLEPDSMQQLRADSAAGGVCITYAKAGTDVELILVEGLRIGGRVQDETGYPIAAAQVLVQLSVGRIHERTWSDLDGRFTVGGLYSDSIAYRGDRVELIVRHKGRSHAVMELDLGSDLTDLTITLGPGRRIRGRVIDSNGVPIPDTRIIATLLRNVNWISAGPVTNTDAEGRFELHPIAEEPCSVRAVKDGFKSVTVEAGGTTDIEVELRLEAIASIAGRVVDASSGEPVRSFSVRPHGRRSGTRSLSTVTFMSDEGQWRIAHGEIVQGGEFEVRITAPGYGPGRGLVVAADDASHDHCVIRLQRAITLVGIVRDATTGVTLAGAELRGHDAHGGFGRGVITDAHGRFTLNDIGSGPTSLHVRVHGYPPFVHGPFHVGVGPGTQRVEIDVTSGVTLRGRLEGFADLADAMLQVAIDDDLVEVPIAADATFAIAGIGRGARTMYLTLSQVPRVGHVYRVIVPDTEGDPVVLPAKDGDATLTVNVDGATHGMASVTILSTGTGVVHCFQRSLGFIDGTFRVAALAPGRYRVNIGSDGQRGSAEVDVRGDTRLTVVVSP